MVIAIVVIVSLLIGSQVSLRLASRIYGDKTVAMLNSDFPDGPPGFDFPEGFGPDSQIQRYSGPGCGWCCNPITWGPIIIGWSYTYVCNTGH